VGVRAVGGMRGGIPFCPNVAIDSLELAEPIASKRRERNLNDVWFDLSGQIPNKGGNER